MTIHEFGKEHKDTIVMFHPVGVMWDIFEYVIPTLEKNYHLVIPALPGHDPDNPESDFISVENVEESITEWLLKNGFEHVKCLYGCSMGGGIVTRMLATQRIQTDGAVIDAGMTPYQFPKIFTYFIGIRDFLMMEIGKHGSIKVLGSVFDPNKYSEDDLLYVKKVLRNMSAKTIWNGFYSANNYSMPDTIHKPDCPVQYWYGEQEKKARKWDIAYIRKNFPDTFFVENKGQDHAEFFTLHPEEFCEKLKVFIRGNTKQDGQFSNTR